MLVICGAEPEMSMSSAFMGVPGGGLSIFTARDQLNIFWVLNFENLYFFGCCSQLLYCFGAVR